MHKMEPLHLAALIAAALAFSGASATAQEAACVRLFDEKPSATTGN